MSIYSVVPISRSDAEDYIINIHYAHRWASTSYLFGLLRHSQLVGVIAYGTPPSSPLRIGLAGKWVVSQIKYTIVSYPVSNEENVCKK